MSAMKNYFNLLLKTLCGIPSITLLDTVEDWQAIRRRAEAFAEFDLKDGVRSLLPGAGPVPEGGGRGPRPGVLAVDLPTAYLARFADGRPAAAPLFEHAATRRRPQVWAREQVTRICKLAGVPRVTPRGLGGTLATMGREIGHTSQQVADLLGHASPAITDRSYIDGQRAAEPIGAPRFGCWTVAAPRLESAGEARESGNVSWPASFRSPGGRDSGWSLLPDSAVAVHA